MGLLDWEFDSPQNQGLLAFGLNMMANSGPSTTPRSLGQIFGASGQAGLNAYQAAIQRQKDDQMRAMQMKQAQMGLDKGGMELETMKTALEKQKQLEAARKELYSQGMQQAPQSMPQVSGVNNMGGSMMAGQGSMPDFMRHTTMSPQPATAPQSSTQDNYGRYLKTAQFFEAKGFGEEAQKYYDLAEKFRPKIKDQKTLMGPSGKPVNVITYEDGRQEVSQFGAMPENQIINLGDRQMVVDKNTAQNGQLFNIGQSPDSKASNAVAWANHGLAQKRFNNELANQNQPVWNNEVGAFITKPTAQNPNGSMIPLAGYQKPDKALTEDQGKATGWLVQAENAWKNMQSVAYDSNGKLTGAAKPGIPDAIASVPGMGPTANFIRGADRQKFMQASSSLSESLLRAATGAGINKEEAEQKTKEVTPQFGDSAEVIKQKMDAIPLYLESLKVRAGPGAKKAAGIVPNTVNFNNVGNKASGTINFGDLK